MSDTPPSATPMPAQPVATVTSPEAPSPPADPLPVFVPPSVTDPVSNLDFPPVDDAFALEMRAETIEQLVGGDALRRGESERIEAGRSQTNADLVAGRDRVRVQRHAPRTHRPRTRRTGHAPPHHRRWRSRRPRRQRGHGAARRSHARPLGRGRRHRRGDDRRHGGRRRHPGDDAARPVGARADGGGGAHRDVHRRCGADGDRARRTTSASTVPGRMRRGSRRTPARCTSRAAARSGR